MILCVVPQRGLFIREYITTPVIEGECATRNKVILTSFALLGLMTALAIYLVWPRNQLEVQVRDNKKSPDGRWTAVVQMEVNSAPAFVDDAVYAVRLKGAAQKDGMGDLVLNVPVNYPTPEPSVNWKKGALVVTLAEHQKYQYFTTPVDGVPITLHQK